MDVPRGPQYRMPELPEVETSRRGIEPWIIDTTITKVVVRDRRLRWPVEKGVERRLKDQPIHSVERRAKYLLINTGNGTAILHLGICLLYTSDAADDSALV